MICRTCSAPLTDDNWFPSFRKLNSRLCKACHSSITCKRARAKTAADPKPVGRPRSIHAETQAQLKLLKQLKKAADILETVGKAAPKVAWSVNADGTQIVGLLVRKAEEGSDNA